MGSMRASAGKRILMLLENNSYPHDSRVRREALALVAAGFRVTVISPGEEARFGRYEIDGVGVCHYPQAPEREGLLGYVAEYAWTMFFTALLMMRVAVQQGFDVIHAHNPPDTFAVLAAPYKLFGKRFVFDHHDLSPEMYRAKFRDEGSPVVEIVLRLLEQITFRMADMVIATNDSYRDIALGRGRKTPDQVVVVRNAPNLERVRRVDPDDELRHRADTIIGYVGEMGHQDGVDYLLRAIEGLVNELGEKDVLAVIVGQGDALSELEALSADLGIEEHIWFTGRISDADLMSYLSTADICVDPDPSNPFNDRSSMIKMTEYMALGKPIVAFDLPEHRVTAGDAAVYARPNDELEFAKCIVDLIDDPERRGEMGEVGRRRLESLFAWPLQEEKLIAAYDRLLDVGSRDISET